MIGDKQLASPKVPYDLQNNLVMDAAIKIDLQTLYRFSKSARLSCNKCTIVLLVDRHTAQNNDYQLLANVFKLTSVIYETLAIKHAEMAFRSTSIHTKRWIIFHDYLQNLLKLGTSFDNVFFCDVSGTIFQTNVFVYMESRGEGLYAFMEDVNISIGKQTVNSDWIKTCYSQETLQAVHNNSISCSGTALGSWSAIVAYLSSMKAQILSRSDACLRSDGNDQGIHNYIVHNRIIPNTTVYYIPHENGFVGTVGLPNWLNRNKFGLVLNANKEIYAVVHQLNRSPQLLSQFDRQFHILSDDILNKKL